MARLTKGDIERKLLTGLPVNWNDGSKKPATLLLGTPKARSLFEFLRKSTVRSTSDLTEAFLTGLHAAYASDPDPALSLAATPDSTAAKRTWKLSSLETEGFGGVNVWKGKVFRFEFERESLLIEGPNASGKSSFTSAIVWALTGERPRDHGDAPAHESKPVFQASDKGSIGSWPPVACYPETVAELTVAPYVRVTLTFSDSVGQEAKVERILSDGNVSVSVDPLFQIPSVFIETGLVMPARLGTLRLGGGSGRLTDAVQMLTGMDDLAAIGLLVEALCHKGRDYLSYKKKDLTAAKKEFQGCIDLVRNTLADLNVAVSEFKPSDTSDKAGPMAAFGKMLSDKAAELTAVISRDLKEGLALDTANAQARVISAIGAAEDDVREGLSSLKSWQVLIGFDRIFDDDVVVQVRNAVSAARLAAEESRELLAKSKGDGKFQLKAVAAHWHSKNESGPIVACPLCDGDMNHCMSLAEELEALRSTGSAAAREYDDNVNAILAELDAALPLELRKITEDLLAWEPRREMVSDMQSCFVEKDRYRDTLAKFATIVATALTSAPQTELLQQPSSSDASLHRVERRAIVIERAILLVEWYRAEAAAWRAWWEETTGSFSINASEISNPSAASITEGLSPHLSRLSGALIAAKPYRVAADALRSAYKTGLGIVQIEVEVDRRLAVATLLEPLKSLGPLSQAFAREAIDGLSGRIGKLLDQILLTGRFQFHDAQLVKKEGVVVYGGFGDVIRIDATLIANTSWLRAVLWAFTFALREEAVEQNEQDLLPLLVFDDPQSTFDMEHRYRWALYVAALQNGPSQIQLVLTSYDRIFLEALKMYGVNGRQAMSAAAGPELGYMGLFEGDSLDRKWKQVEQLKTPEAAQDYMSAMRVYLEGLLRLMLRGEDANVSTFVVGESREKLTHLNASQIGPWDRGDFKKLAGLLGKAVPQIKFIESAHHASGLTLGMSEAISVEEYWRKKLKPSLEICFRVARDYLILHGGLAALHSPTPVVELPEGYRSKIAQIPLRLVGKAAALTDGRTADGCIDLDVYAGSPAKKITLAQHSAYRLTAATLEPVARPGDILLVKEAGEPSAKSLVVALSDDRVLARRFEVAENQSDIAVLTARAINPRKIAAPVIARKSTFVLHKVVCVLYEESTWNAFSASEMEVCECSGEAALNSLTKKTLGLVEVVGQSAEPHALHGQYLIVEDEIPALEALQRLDGRPIIASDSEDNRYFKRLRIGKDRVVLESMDSGGDYAPIILSLPGEDGNRLEKVWPVAGVLFELPK